MNTDAMPPVLQVDYGDLLSDEQQRLAKQALLSLQVDQREYADQIGCNYTTLNKTINGAIRVTGQMVGIVNDLFRKGEEARRRMLEAA